MSNIVQDPMQQLIKTIDATEPQDALDGAALRRLLEALPEGWTLQMEGPIAPWEEAWEMSVFTRYALHIAKNGSTIAEAADKCREAL